MTHSTHCVCGYKDHLGSETGNPLLLLLGLLFPITRKGFMHHPRDRIVYTVAFDEPVVEH